MKVRRRQGHLCSILVAFAMAGACCWSAVSAHGDELKTADDAIRAETKDTLHAALDEQAEEAGDAHGGDDVKNPLVTDPDLALYTLLVFGLLMLLLGKFAWRPIAEALDQRERTINDQIDAAARTQDDAKKLLAEYERRLAAAGDEVRGLLDTARRDAANVAQEVHAKALAEAEAVKDRALRDIETATGSALKELAEQSSRLAISLAGRIVQAELDPSRHNRLIEEAMSRFPAGSANTN